MDQRFHIEVNCYFLVRSFLEMCQSLDQCIRIDAMIKQQEYFDQSPNIDVQKYFNDISYSIETQNQMFEYIKGQPQQTLICFGIQKELFEFQQKLSIELYQNSTEYFNMLKYNFKMFLSLFKRIQAVILINESRAIKIISKYPEFLQKEYEYKNQLQFEINRLIKFDIQGENLLIKQNNIPYLIDQFKPMYNYLAKHSSMDEKEQYQLLYIKIKFLINIYRIINGFQVTLQHKELFAFSTGWDENLKLWAQIYDNYFYDHFDSKDKYKSKVLYFAISTNKKFLKNSIAKFFSNNDVRQSMKQVQQLLKIDEDLSDQFINKIKIVSNPDGCILCETIKDFAIIINVHSLIDKYRGEFNDQEFQNLFTAYAIVLTIQGWTQLQLLKCGKLLHIVYERQLDQSDEQYMLNHNIFGAFENKSNLRFLDQDIIEQILKFKTIFQCQQYLKQVLQKPLKNQKLYEFQ